jgi:hypothetical protein
MEKNHFPGRPMNTIKNRAGSVSFKKGHPHILKVVKTL